MKSDRVRTEMSIIIDRLARQTDHDNPNRVALIKACIAIRTIDEKLAKIERMLREVLNGERGD